MNLVKKTYYEHINYEEDLKNLLNSIKDEVNKLEGLTNKNGCKKDLNRIIHKLNEMRTMTENYYEKAKKLYLKDIMDKSKKLIKRIRSVEHNLFRSLKNGNYYQF